MVAADTKGYQVMREEGGAATRAEISAQAKERKKHLERVSKIFEEVSEEGEAQGQGRVDAEKVDGRTGRSRRVGGGGIARERSTFFAPDTEAGTGVGRQHASKAEAPLPSRLGRDGGSFKEGALGGQNGGLLEEIFGKPTEKREQENMLQGSRPAEEMGLNWDDLAMSRARRVVKQLEEDDAWRENSGLRAQTEPEPDKEVRVQGLEKQGVRMMKSEQEAKMHFADIPALADGVSAFERSADRNREGNMGREMRLRTEIQR